MVQKSAQGLEDKGIGLSRLLAVIAICFERSVSGAAGGVSGVLLLALGSAQWRKAPGPPLHLFTALTATTREDPSYKEYFTMAVKRPTFGIMPQRAGEVQNPHPWKSKGAAPDSCWHFACVPPARIRILGRGRYWVPLWLWRSGSRSGNRREKGQNPRPLESLKGAAPDSSKLTCVLPAVAAKKTGRWYALVWNKNGREVYTEGTS